MSASGSEVKSPPPHHHEKGFALLRLIGAFKLLKSAGLVIACFAALRLINTNNNEQVLAWVRAHIAPGNRHLQRLIEKVSVITTEQWKLIAGILAAYAVMFMVEGIGLLMMQDWAEWMTIITTSALIPVEIYEVIHRPGVAKVITLVINAIVAVYLAAHLWNERQLRKKNPPPGAPMPT